MFISSKTSKGNVGTSTVSQEEADSQARQMDANGCTDCTNCTSCTNCLYCHNCTSCHNCTDCTYCTYCTDCTDCHNCRSCTSCYYCRDCLSSTGCYYCRDCTECTLCTDCTGCRSCYNCTDCVAVLRWTGPEAKSLLALNGLRWPVAVSKTHLQIGCKNYSHKDWGAFTDDQTSAMDPQALEFWTQYKEVILALAHVARNDPSTKTTLSETPSYFKWIEDRVSEVFKEPTSERMRVGITWRDHYGAARITKGASLEEAVQQARHLDVCLALSDTGV